MSPVYNAKSYYLNIMSIYEGLKCQKNNFKGVKLKTVQTLRMKHHRRSTMRKEGPCCHCGVKETPLWRNGPPKKPVLCNACGSRWRIRGNLDDYVPNKQGTVVRRGKKRSRRVYYNPSKWIDYKDDEEDEESNNEDESVKESSRCKKNRHSGSGSESITTIASEEPGNLYDVVVQSGIIISDNDEKDVEELKVLDNYAELAWTPSNEDEDEDWPLEHIKKLQRELYEMFKNEKSSSSSSSSCSSLAESPMEDEEVLLYNLNNPHFCENEIGLGSVLLKPP